jgi:hypothetical protein
MKNVLDFSPTRELEAFLSDDGHVISVTFEQAMNAYKAMTINERINLKGNFSSLYVFDNCATSAYLNVAFSASNGPGRLTEKVI